MDVTYKKPVINSVRYGNYWHIEIELEKRLGLLRGFFNEAMIHCGFVSDEIGNDLTYKQFVKRNDFNYLKL